MDTLQIIMKIISFLFGGIGATWFFSWWYFKKGISRETDKLYKVIDENRKLLTEKLVAKTLDNIKSKGLQSAIKDYKDLAKEIEKSDNTELKSLIKKQGTYSLLKDLRSSK